jgi:hypothetical protein
MDSDRLWAIFTLKGTFGVQNANAFCRTLGSNLRVAEAVSLAFLQCVLKGLHKSPKIIRDENLFTRPGVFSVEDVSCLIIPDGCPGLPTIAALK